MKINFAICWSSIRPKASLILLNIYHFRFNIFKKGTFKGLFEKKGTLSDNFGGGGGGGVPPTTPALESLNCASIVNIKQGEFNTNENKVSKIIKNLDIRKTYQGSDITTKTIKLNVDLFSSFICQHFNYCISVGEFPNELKRVDVIPVNKKRINVIKVTISQLVYSQRF